MGLNTVKLQEISITSASESQILEELKKYLENAPSDVSKVVRKTIKPLVIFTPNPEQLMYARDHVWFTKILNWADITLPDGIGISWAVRFLGIQGSLPSVPGVGFMEKLVSLSEKEGVRIGLIGGRAIVAVKALECLRSSLPKLDGWAEEGPEIRFKPHVSSVRQEASVDADIHDTLELDAVTQGYIDELVERIEKTNTQVIFVGFGAPKQEVFMHTLSLKLQASSVKPVILMAVGGSFDELSGLLRRPPSIFESLGIKWLWRLIQEPWRWRRQLALVRFVALVFKARISHTTTI